MLIWDDRVTGVRRTSFNIGQLAATAGVIALLLVLTVVLVSVFVSPSTTWTVRIALAAFCLLAVLRPDHALLVTIAFAGFGSILSALGGGPTLRAPEILVVASLAGGCVRALPSGSDFRRAVADQISAPVVLFAIATVIAAVVWQRVYQFETAYPSVYLEMLRRFVTREYFIEPSEFWVLVSAVAILEGLALYVVVAALCRLHDTFFERAVRMLAAGGAGLGLLSIDRLGQILLRNPGAIHVLRSSAAGLRISPQISDYIAAGSYFALCWLAALGIAIGSTRRRLWWLLAGIPMLAALYLTGSRSVIAAALVGVAVLVFILVARKIASVRAIVAFAVLAVVAMVVTYPLMNGRDVVGETARLSLVVRSELVRTGVRVIATRPLFGVGIERFYLVAAGLTSPELRALWMGRMNPHNDFLRFGAELGLVGLGLFLWVLVDAGRRIRSALETGADARFAGLAAGLIAFLVTCFVSNPLMVHEVSYVFWIAIGLAVGQSARVAGALTPGLSSESASRSPRFVTRGSVALVLGALLICSVPFRIRQEIRSVDLRRVTYGLFDWSREPDGTTVRWSGPRATLFADSDAQVVEMSVSGTLPAGGLQQVEISVDGRPANRLTVGAGWQRLRLPLPAVGSSEPRRIDIAVSPSWVPADVIPGNSDHRTLGVKLRDIKMMKAEAGR